MSLPPKPIRDASMGAQAMTCVLLCERWLQTHPEDIWVKLEYAEMLFKMARYDDAEEVYRALCDALPDKRWACFNQIGNLNRYRGRHEEAEAWYRKATLEDPDEAASFIFLGAIQARQGKLKEAEATHRRAIQCKEGCIDEAHHNLGLVLRGQGRLEEAAECFKIAIQICPDYENAQEALEDVTRALELMADESQYDCLDE